MEVEFEKKYLRELYLWRLLLVSAPICCCECKWVTTFKPPNKTRLCHNALPRCVRFVPLC